MATLNLNDPQDGTTADASLIATNNAALKTVVNGGLEDGNIAADAAIGPSKLAGYPADNTKFLRGDGTWNAPIAGGFTPSAPATSLPVSPANLQQAILVDSTSAPTYAWLFQYSSSASKWIFIGGDSTVGHDNHAASVTATATTFAGASNIFTTGVTWTADGTSDYTLTFSAMGIDAGGGTSTLAWTLDGVQKDTLVSRAYQTTARGPLGDVTVSMAVPAAGSHTVNARLWVNSGTGTVYGPQRLLVRRVF